MVTTQKELDTGNIEQYTSWEEKKLKKKTEIPRNTHYKA